MCRIPFCLRKSALAHSTHHFSAIAQLSTQVTNKKTQCDDDVTAKYDVRKEVSILFPRDIVE
jgi:hypothetical protein